MLIIASTVSIYAQGQADLDGVTAIIRSRLLQEQLTDNKNERLQVLAFSACGNSTIAAYSVVRETEFSDKPTRIYVGHVSASAGEAVEVTQDFDLAGDERGTFHSVSANINVIGPSSACLTHVSISVTISGSGALAQAADSLFVVDDNRIMRVQSFGITGTRAKLRPDMLRCTNSTLSVARADGEILFRLKPSHQEHSYVVMFSANGKRVLTAVPKLAETAWRNVRRDFDSLCTLANKENQ